ncbi:3-oxoacid CoA-transferase subunit A [Thermopolyspora sp. NPDC052614]|uniref:CoA transferase subunit A n=1 Tax=Thermopolyspora sp. NPDC052614 TaxID=3155682 RepID=UPI0034473471
MIDKIRGSALELMEMIPSGSSIAIGGFGVTGVPMDLCNALCELDRRDLHIVANNAGIDPQGVGRLAQEGRIRKFTGSFPSNKEFHRRLVAGEIEVELVPQGTLAERLRAAGAGIPAFYTPTSAGTDLALGAYPARYDESGRPLAYMPPKDVRVFDGRPAVLEYALHVDFALVKADRADRLGNVAFRLSARNFNPVAAMAAATTFVESRHLVEVGELAPDDIHLPGIYVDYVVQSQEGAGR